MPRIASVAILLMIVLLAGVTETAPALPQKELPGAAREAGAAQEKVPQEPVAEARLTGYWILDAGAANAETLLERFYLPTSLSVLRWTHFRLEGSTVSLESSGGYRVSARHRVLTEEWAGGTLYGYELRVSFTGQPDPPAPVSRLLSVSFAYPTGRGGGRLTPQPLQQALITAVRDSGRSSGRARLLEIDYRGSGRFHARVELE